jgi:hypothetical protein
MTRTKKLARPYWILALLIALSAVLGAAALRAAARSLMAPPAAVQAAEASPAAPAAAPAPAPPAPATPGTPAKSAPPATPAGVIRDDPTVAPDKGQSADNNVSFPVDI